MSLLATLSVVGCICPPAGYYSGMQRHYVPNHITYDNGCDPCGATESGCGVIEYSGNPCVAQPCVPKIVDCRTTFSNLGNGIFLIGRGVLDVTAAPFVIVSNALSNSCRYELLTHCDPVYYAAPRCQTVEPCTSTCTSGCDACSGGYTEGIQFNTSVQNRTTALPSPIYRSNGVIQASYQEPTAPVMKFVHPK